MIPAVGFLLAALKELAVTVGIEVAETLVVSALQSIAQGDNDMTEEELNASLRDQLMQAGWGEEEIYALEEAGGLTPEIVEGEVGREQAEDVLEEGENTAAYHEGLQQGSDAQVWAQTRRDVAVKAFAVIRTTESPRDFHDAVERARAYKFLAEITDTEVQSILDVIDAVDDII